MPLQVLHHGIADEPDPEGRVLRVDIDGVDLVSVYLPSGSSSDEAQARKKVWMNRFAPWMATIKRRRRPVLVGGDLNIARDEVDIYHWKGNLKNSGFLPHERKWMNGLVASGWSDLVRADAGDVDGPYTWWSNRGRAWDNNVGWRIDYHAVTPGLKNKVKNSAIYRDERFSDHAPVTMDYDWLHAK